MARPLEYNEQVANEICSLMSEGKGLREICEREGMPARSTVLRWVERHDAFRDQYARAREAMFDWMAEEIIRIADDASGDYFIEDRDGKSIVVPDHARVQRARLQVDSRKWLLSKVAPRKYGDKVELLAASEQPKELKVSWQKIERVILDPVYPRFDADGNLLKPGTPEYEAAGPSERERAFRDEHREAPERPAVLPRQITFNPTPPPADLSPEAWSAIARVSELIERIAPGDEKPEHVFGLIEGFLRSHFVASLA